MPNLALPRSAPTNTSAPIPRPGVAAVLALWLALVLVLGAGDAFVTPPGQAPLPILLGVLIPIAAFFAACGLSRRFRDFALATDLRLISAIQAWRFAGFGFVALYAHGVLPGLFAWPAGLGDMAVGLTAPWIALALLRRPDFAAGRTFLAWNLFGILDLVVAVSMGALATMLASGAEGEITGGPMATLPLLLIPVYLVPLFVMLHGVALLQTRHRRAA